MRKPGRILFLTVLMIGLLGPLLFAAETVVASQYSDRYHKPGCKIASKIRNADKITFNSIEDAQETGLVPCKKCYPFQVTSNFQTKA